MNDDLARYRETFFAEAREHLEELNDGLLALEKDPSAPGVINTVFRAAHTIKGMAATMGFQTISTLTHKMEDVLDKLRAGTLQMMPELFDVLFHAVDTLESILSTAQTEDEPPLSCLNEVLPKLEGWLGTDLRKVTPTAASLQAVEEDLSSYEKNVVAAAQSRGYKAFMITVTLSPDCLMKGVRAFLVFQKLEACGEVLRAEPPVEDLEEEKFGDSFRLLYVTQRSVEEINTLLLGVSDVRTVEINELVLRSAASTGKELQPAVEERQRHLSTQTVRIDIHRLDNLMNLVGELVITKTRLDQLLLAHSSPELEETLKSLTRVAGGLQDAVMKARMVPLAQVFNRFPRMVRDLARELGKQVDFLIEGEETELDRSVIDEIGDPLVHLLRNAVDHGIEPQTTRAANGKNPMGRIRLSACYEGNHVLIAVEDDGEGISRSAVLAKAKERGLLGSREGEELNDQEVYRLLFLPGFSTSKTVSDVSGRGVGLDVVESKIESLGGSVEVRSRHGEGTRFTIRLPLTLAIIQALLVNLGTETYAIPLEGVEEIQVVAKEDVKLVRQRQVILLRGEVVPLVCLGPLLGCVAESEDTEDISVVVVRGDTGRAGLVVSGLVGQREIVIKSLGRFLGNVAGIGGATILGDGRVALILDPSGILALAAEENRFAS
ncbi:MAG: chemotaxis protein CheW [bacterium]|jgi:two-component system chemotaxis sensor kinase CheA